jgi:hypothetical protein
MRTESYPASSKWPSATRERPCPKCGKVNRCRIAPDDLAGICWRSGASDVWHDDNGQHNGNGQHRRADPPPTRPKPTFISAEKAIEAACPRGGKLIYVKTYPRDAMRVARFAMPDGEKEFRPVHPVANGWAIGDPPGLLPLYRGDELPEDGPIIVVEGEKCADLARELGLAAVASAHGSKSPHKSEWQPLAGRDVWILPDADQPGEKYAQAVARILANVSCVVKIVRLPGLAEGEDIEQFDAAIGAQPEATRAEIQRLASEAEVYSLPMPDWTTAEPDAPILPTFTSARELCKGNPPMNPCVIDGLLRLREIGNAISVSKGNKSWLMMQLAVSVASGRMFLGKFPVARGDVLIIDNELHKNTLANRLPKVAAAMGIAWDEIADHIFIESLRGRLRDIHALRPFFNAIEPGRFTLIILDALYRLLPPGCDENSNANMASVYNAIDGYTERLGAAVFLVHHSSKGSQSGKSVTDTGAGAGSQSRACDTHFILRPHEEDGCAVVDAAVRSFPPIEPFCLRWNFPIWTLADDLDPDKLRQAKPRKKAEPIEAPEPWTAEKFATAFLTGEPKTEATICAEAVGPDLSERKAKLLLRAACESGKGFKWESTDRKKPIRYANREPNLTEIGGAK